MAQVKTKINGITLDELMQLDEDKREEVVNGIVEDNTTMTELNHTQIVENLFLIFAPYVRKNKIGNAHIDNLTYILHMEEDEDGKIIRQTRIPDFSFVRPNCIHEGWDRKRPLLFAPDLAVEVVSPTEKAGKLMEKIGLYLTYGTEQVWVIYPAKRELHPYFADDNAPRIYVEDDPLIAEALSPDFALPIANIFVDYEI